MFRSCLPTFVLRSARVRPFILQTGHYVSSLLGSVDYATDPVTSPKEFNDKGHADRKQNGCSESKGGRKRELASLSKGRLWVVALI